MILRKTFVSCATLALLIGTGITDAHAGDFASATGTPGAFNFTKGSGFSLSGTQTSSLTINGTTYATDITFTATTNPSSPSVYMGGVLVQNLTGITETFTNTAPGGGTLLTLTNGSGTLVGGYDSHGNYDVSINVSGNNILSSPLYGGGTALSGVQTDLITLTGVPVPITESGGQLESFTGNLGSQSFTSSSVPEASTLLGLGGLVVGGGLLGLRRRKAA
jgi:hypothetical protein